MTFQYDQLLTSDSAGTGRYVLHMHFSAHDRFSLLRGVRSSPTKARDTIWHHVLLGNLASIWQLKLAGMTSIRTAVDKTMDCLPRLSHRTLKTPRTPRVSTPFVGCQGHARPNMLQ